MFLYLSVSYIHQINSIFFRFPPKKCESLATIHEALINQNPPKNGPWDAPRTRDSIEWLENSKSKCKPRNGKKHACFCLISVSASGFCRLQHGFSENGHHFKKRFILENLRFSNVTNSRASRDTFRIVIPYTYLHGWGELSCMAPSTHPETNIALKVRWFEDYFSVGIPF